MELPDCAKSISTLEMNMINYQLIISCVAIYLSTYTCVCMCVCLLSNSFVSDETKLSNHVKCFGLVSLFKGISIFNAKAILFEE